MARPKKDVSEYLGERVSGTKLTVLSEAGRDSRGRIRMEALCDCGKHKCVILSQVLAGHTKSCGCLKHQRFVEHTQRAVDRLTPTLIMQCFLDTVDKNAPKPALPPDVITAGYFRRAEQLKALPYIDMVDIQLHVRRHEKYAQIAMKSGLHPAEVAWIYKHVIKPDIEALRECITRSQCDKTRANIGFQAQKP